MDKEKAIRQFALQRPNSCAVYGYGSSLFKQEGQEQSKSSMIDLVFLVEDLKSWHLQNIQKNPKDYSFTGRLYIKLSNLKKLKGHNKITYLSYIKDGDLMFKYGIMELEDFLQSLSEWDSFFVAGRFQKPIVNIASNMYVNRRLIDGTIKYNRDCALRIACLFCDSIVSVEKIYTTLCGLSYHGDIRMKLAENPDKVKNIVNGSYGEFLEMYDLNKPYLNVLDNGEVEINHELLLKEISLLPVSLIKFLKEQNTDFNDLDSVRINIDLFLSKRNRKDSGAQAYECFKTNGIVKSVPYVLAKMKKRFKGQ